MLGWFSSGIIILPLRFWKKRAEIRDATEEIKRGMESRDTGGEGEMYLWDLGDRHHCWKSGSGCNGGGGADEFLSKREGRAMLQ